MPMRLHTQMPSLEGATDWINSKPNSSALVNSLVLVYFWALSCHVCHENFPKLQNWCNTYGPKGLKVLLIHCPRMKTDVNFKKVKATLASFNIKEPCGIDNLHKIKQAFNNEVWPAFYLFDRDGKLKRRTAGRAGYSMLKPLLEQLFE